MSKYPSIQSIEVMMVPKKSIAAALIVQGLMASVSFGTAAAAAGINASVSGDNGAGATVVYPATFKGLGVYDIKPKKDFEIGYPNNFEIYCRVGKYRVASQLKFQIKKSDLSIQQGSKATKLILRLKSLDTVFRAFVKAVGNGYDTNTVSIRAQKLLIKDMEKNAVPGLKLIFGDVTPFSYGFYTDDFDKQFPCLPSEKKLTP